MQHQVQPAEFLSNGPKDTRDFFIFSDIAREDERVRAERSGEFLDIFFKAFALIGKSEFCAGLVPSLGNRPGDRALVGNSENDPVFLSEQGHDAIWLNNIFRYIHAPSAWSNIAAPA